MDKIKITFPEKVKCDNCITLIKKHNKAPSENCVNCKKLNAKRKRQHTSDMRNMAYDAIFKNWDSIYNEVKAQVLETNNLWIEKDKLSEQGIEQTVVIKMRGVMAETIYPWEKSKKKSENMSFGKIFYCAFDDLARRKNSWYIARLKRKVK